MVDERAGSRYPGAWLLRDASWLWDGAAPVPDFPGGLRMGIDYVSAYPAGTPGYGPPYPACIHRPDTLIVQETICADCWLERHDQISLTNRILGNSRYGKTDALKLVYNSLYWSGVGMGNYDKVQLYWIGITKTYVHDLSAGGMLHALKRDLSFTLKNIPESQLNDAINTVLAEGYKLDSVSPHSWVRPGDDYDG